MLLLSVKPQHMAEALAGVGEVAGPGTLIISIAAGIGTRFIEMNLGGSHSSRVIGSMPNTPMLVGEGMVAIARGRHATEKDAADARRLFGEAASVIEVPEDRIDAVTERQRLGSCLCFFSGRADDSGGNRIRPSPGSRARQLAVKTVLALPSCFRIQRILRPSFGKRSLVRAAPRRQRSRTWNGITLMGR